MTTALRVLIVDDEPLAREGLRLRLARQPDVEVVADCEDATTAATAIEQLRPDVVFLDIQMPGLDGFGLAERFERTPLPAVVFVTAHAEHALRAFRVGALDYLVKPYDDETLGASVDRARAYVGQVRAADAARQAQLVDAGSQPAGPLRLSVRENGRVVFLEASTIDWVEAAGDHVRVHVGSRSFMLRATMQGLEARLDPARFVRVHRTAIVAMAGIRELQPYSRGEYVVVLADGTKLPLSRRYRPRVTQALEGAR